VEGIAEMPWRL